MRESCSTALCAGPEIPERCCEIVGDCYFLTISKGTSVCMFHIVGRVYCVIWASLNLASSSARSVLYFQQSDQWLRCRSSSTSSLNRSAMYFHVAVPSGYSCRSLMSISASGFFHARGMIGGVLCCGVCKRISRDVSSDLAGFECWSRHETRVKFG